MIYHYRCPKEEVGPQGRELLAGENPRGPRKKQQHPLRRLRVALFWVLVCLATTQVSKAKDEEERRVVNILENRSDIINDILNRSDGKVRPNMYGPPVVVKVDFHLVAISSINEVDMDFILEIYMRQSWRDYRLAFNQPGVKQVTIIPRLLDKVWTPDIYFPNEKYGEFHDVTVPNKMFKIYPNGTVMYSIRLTLKLSCLMELAYFPLDAQVCHMNISTYLYDKEDVILEWMYPDRVLGEIAGASLARFRLGPIKCGYCDENYQIGNFSCLRAEFHLRRLFGFYLIISYVPSVLVVILSWISFWVDKGAVPARVTLGVTTVLTLATQMSTSRSASMMVSYAKAMDVWYTVCMVCVFLSLLEFAFVNVLDTREKQLKKKHSIKPHENHSNDIELQAVSELNDNNVVPTVSEETAKCSIRTRCRIGCITADGLDRASRIIFPVAFFCFNCTYWIAYT